MHVVKHPPYHRSPTRAADYVRYISKEPHLRRLLAESGVDFVELFPPVERLDALFLEDGNHYSFAGQQWLAETLHQEIQRRYALEP